MEIDVTMTQVYIDALDNLVEKGLFLCRNQVIGQALRDIFRRYGIETFNMKEAEEEVPISSE